MLTRQRTESRHARVRAEVLHSWRDLGYASDTIEGYSKPVTIDGNPGFEAYEIEGKHSTLWVMVAKRYFVQIELQGADPKELQDWIKRVDLKKLAEIKS